MQKTNERKAGAATTDSTTVARNYKDTVFRMLFREKENLLSLYNALNGTSYTDIDALEITTLEHAVYMNYKNDISFVLDSELMLYEHQSTVNPNMPLRDLIYVAKVWQGRIREQNIYGKVPVRYHIKDMPLSEAVETAVDHCIRNGILSSFLLKNRAEAIEMCIFEFDEERFLKSERECAFQEGRLEGKKESIRQGEALLTKLIQLLIDTGKSAEIPRIISDREYRERLYQENRLV